MNTNVYIRNEKTSKEVAITDTIKPDINEVMMDKWQNIINIVAEILEVPAGLIMQITKESMQVFIKSDNEDNPYKVGGQDVLGKGLYCENVIGMDEELHIPNALESEVWKDNPDVDHNMISYYGLPLHWPDKSFFGTICVLDRKENHYSALYKKLMKSFQQAIEDDLKLLMNQQQMDYLANRDHLTGVYNHASIYSMLEDELQRSRRTKNYFSVVFLDIDGFSGINQDHSYEFGDVLLKEVAALLDGAVRTIDYVGRWSGDEFVILCPNTNEAGAKKLVAKLKEKMNAHTFSEGHKLTCSFGYCAYASIKDTVEYMISKANRELQKEKKKNQ
jgi:diguanylate cyclase (GGDEF)-like protein